MMMGLGLSGCEPPPEGTETGNDPDFIEIQRPFVNNLSFTNCTSTQQNTIKAAGDILLARINEPSFTGASLRACLNDTFLSRMFNQEWAGDIRNEFITFRSVTQIQCVDSTMTSCGGVSPWLGCAQIGISGESLMLDTNFVNTNSSTTIAGVVAHELVHNYGYTHPSGISEGEFTWTGNERARACVSNSNVMPSGQSRTNGMPGENELGYIGRFGGSPFEFTGTGTQFLSGIRSWANQTMNGLELVFEDATGARSFMPLVGSATGFHNAPPNADRLCRSGSVVTGIFGSAGATLNQLSFRCAPRGNVNSPDQTFNDGNAGPYAFTTTCPAGKAVRAVRGRAGTTINQLRLVCDDVNKSFSPDHAPHAVGPILGTQSGVKFSLRCSGNGALFSFTGNSDSLVRRFGGLCKATGSTLPITPSFGTHPASNWLGGTTGTAYTNGCNSGAGELMVGIQVRSGSSIDAVAPICAPAAQWDQSSSGARNVTTFSGGGGGTLTQVQCPAFQFLVGLEAWGTDRAMALQAVCADMR